MPLQIEWKMSNFLTYLAKIATQWRWPRMGRCTGCGVPYVRWPWSQPYLKASFCGGRCQTAWHGGFQSGFKFAEDRTRYGHVTRYARRRQ